MVLLVRTTKTDKKKDYLDNWICYALYFPEIEQKKLSRKGKINLLINLLSSPFSVKSPVYLGDETPKSELKRSTQIIFN